VDAVSVVNQMLASAIKLGASDIHLESVQNGLRVRYRIDGVLHDQTIVAKDLADQVISRIKILSGIDISKKRIPQDGKFKAEGKCIDFRVSTFPSVKGEKIVVRILDKDQQNITLENLGLDAQAYTKFLDLINKNSGFVLVTGPTGSGKTTTLYAALNKLHKPDKNIITLEDPVEYNIDNITQGNIQTDSGFTFAQGIRALLRQDPDIAMIGEIRDRESAKIAIEASLTGHLVFSTLHTNDAASAIVRLMDMGIEPYLIKASLTGVLAQRLARKICQACKEKYAPSSQEQATLNHFGISTSSLCRGVGCQSCNNLGYKGRVGLFELLELTDELRSVISENPDFGEITKQALSGGMQSLIFDGGLKLKEGIISLEELVKALN
jgi:type II secretory ATPase GspE/PulE/Tfp pilus assembly ATPase PilB-like protein